MLAIAKFLEMPSRNSHHGLGDTYVPYCDGIRPGRGHNQVQIEDRLKTETRATRAMRANIYREITIGRERDAVYGVYGVCVVEHVL